jgi:TPR repeat protein
MQCRLRVGAVIGAIVLSLLSIADAQADKRVALLIGNAAYAHVAPLSNPINDVTRVAEVLRKAGFDVVVGTNLTRLETEDRIRRFLRSAAGADIGLFYYSGHGVQVGDQNYLIPVDAKLTGAGDLAIEAWSLDGVVKGLQSQTAAQLVFLDACRDFPLKASSFYVGASLQPVSASRGLARTTADVGSLLVYATAPGTVAQDGTGDVSPFSGAFAERALEPNREVRQVISNVRRDVMAATSGRQVPWESSSLTRDLYFVRRVSAPVVAPVTRVAIASAQDPVALNPPAPRHPDGAAMTVAVETVPSLGTLTEEGKPVTVGERLSIAQFRSLSYKPAAKEPGHVELVGYSVADDAGNVSRGSIALVYQAQDASARVVEEAPDRVPAYVASQINGASVSVTIGIGPQRILRAAEPGKSDSGGTVVIAAAPSLGVVKAGERTVAAGASFTIAELAHLSYNPQVGSEGKSQPLALDFRDARGDKLASATLTLLPELDRCDVEAAEPLDLQGVAPGVAPNVINPRTAIPACQIAVKAYPQVARFEYQLGRAYLAARDIKNGQVAIRLASALGHVRATYELGYLALNGVGEAIDAVKAASLFRTAAIRSDPFALYAYGKSLYRGRGVAVDRDTGLIMMERAAELGHTYAMNELGAIYLSGDGAKADPARGIRFYEAGVARQDIYSFNNLAIAYANGTGVPIDVDKALALFSKAIQGGHPLAPNELGRLYFKGIGVQKDVAKAAQFYALGVQRGDAWAASNLAFLKASGALGQPDVAEAARLYALSAALERAEVSAASKASLAALPRPAKLAAAKASAARLKLKSPTQANDEALIALVRQEWETANPRMDLF